ncbi:hypothetical protein RFF05_17740 [Bengtsoniella intestinalis]|uniref:hypothetical protein n=1 Tax=Bengtsoniella intestinalis TaxID=3073143 RepID=UPI00391F6AA1
MTYSRRQKAFRRLGILMILVVIGSVTGLYQVLPSMAVRDMEVSYGIAPTDTIARVYKPDIDRTTLYYLQENDDVLMWTSVKFYPFLGGWQRMFAAIVELDETAPLQVSYESIASDDESTVYAFGQVNQEGTVVLQARDWEDDSVLAEFVVPETDYITYQGNTYFISNITEFYNQEFWMSYYPKFMSYLLTPEGETIGEARLEGSSTFYNV